MIDIEKIILAIDEFLNKKNQKVTTPIEINSHLEEKGILKNSVTRPGKPIREILTKGLIPHAYQVGVKWYIPHSKVNLKKLKPIINSEIKNKINIKKSELIKTHKLSTIGNLIINIIEKKYNKSPICIFEYKPNWLFSFPPKTLIEKYPELGVLYSEMTNKEFSLNEKHTELTAKNLTQNQSFDIWIGEPFNFAVEFDEKQHFNQYRKITLKYYNRIDTGFPIELYRELNKYVILKPGKSGFTNLKSNDPLFPRMDAEEKQDNRIKQRAFRDYLKDLMPIDKGYNPTLRIPYHIKNQKLYRGRIK